jgi:membrane protease YdiL (CAAX protease family)
MKISFPHQSIQDQATSRQPDFLKLALLWLLPAQAPRLLTLALSPLSFFANWASTHPTAYLTCFFLPQVLLTGWATIHSLRSFGPALYSKGNRFWSRRLLWLFLALPLLQLYGRDISAFSDSLRQMAEVAGPGQLEPAIHELHERVWKVMAYGSSWLGVIYFSFFTLSVAFFEEAVFSGFVCNRIGTRMGWFAALLLTPLFFSLVHLPVMTKPSAFVLLYAAGLTYTAIRLMSGSIFLAISAHVLINIYVMLPKWLLAWLHFRSLNAGD